MKKYLKLINISSAIIVMELSMCAMIGVKMSYVYGMVFALLFYKQYSLSKMIYKHTKMFEMISDLLEMMGEEINRISDQKTVEQKPTMD